MDGVLVDVSRSYRAAIAETAEVFTGQPVDTRRIQELKNQGGFNDDWALTHAIIEGAGMSVGLQDVVAEFQRRYRGASWDGLIRREEPLLGKADAEALAASGVDLGVVTGRPREEAHWAIERFGWTEKFPVVIAREQQGDRPKPDPFPIELAMDGFDRRHARNTTAYVGDTVDDMHAAAGAGIIAIGFVPPYLEADRQTELLLGHGADCVISSHDSLLGIIRGARSR